MSHTQANTALSARPETVALSGGVELGLAKCHWNEQREGTRGTSPWTVQASQPALSQESSGLRLATTIYEFIRAQALVAPQGGVIWLARPEAKAGFRQQPLPPHVYQGSSGIALFLAAWSRCTGDTRSADLALRAVQPLRRKLLALCARSSDRRPRLSLGGFQGLGSFLYALTRVASLIGCNENSASRHRETARLALGLIQEQTLRKATESELGGGLAGLLLALLALEEGARKAHLPEAPDLLQLAQAVAREIAQRQSGRDANAGGWPGTDGVALSGFAHGASGIAHALLAMFRRDQDPGWLRNIGLALNFERALYRPEQNNWLDPRSGRTLQQSAWCYGGPGMLLPRCRALAMHSQGLLPATAGRRVLERQDTELQAEVALCLAHAQRRPAEPASDDRAPQEDHHDHLCCGNFGRVEILHQASRVLGRPALLDAAKRLACQRLQTLADEGPAVDALRFPDNLAATTSRKRWTDLGLMSGLAGVGYTLLRLQRPELPCLLEMG